MKKFIYLCGMMLLSINMMAQIDLNDQNWDFSHAFIDEFNTSRTWDTNSWLSIPDGVWKAYYGRIIHGHETQIYQYDHCLFDTESGTMRLVSEFDTDSLIPRHKYHLPAGNHTYPNALNRFDTLYYFSGEIAVDTPKFKYGYFEIRCKLPQHKGTFPAFWLHGSNKTGVDRYYEEIDIFEHTRNLLHHSQYWPGYDPPQTIDSARVFTTGIYHNLTGEAINFFTESFARNFPLVLPPSNDLSNWHTYSCEWMPDHVFWYCDDSLVNSYYDQAHIPCHELTLIANYAIDRYALIKDTDIPLWFGSDEMDIDYIRVYQLCWNCDKDEIITCQSDLDDFKYAVKKSVSITSTIEQPVVSAGNKVTFRVTDEFEITGPFEVNSGAEFTVILQACPNNLE